MLPVVHLAIEKPAMAMPMPFVLSLIDANLMTRRRSKRYGYFPQLNITINS